MSVDGDTRRCLSRYAVAHLYVPAMAGAAIATVVVSRQSRLGLITIVVAAVAMSFVVERLIPYELRWNHTHGDRARDAFHAIVNEALTTFGLLVVPLAVRVIPHPVGWPTQLPFGLQVGLAVIVLDAGITVIHWLSHRSDVLWRFHAVHHSVTRLYGFNGLMKHPIHQLVETGAGILPLLILGLPSDVAAALGGLVVLQLLLQHSNADYRVGGLERWFAWNRGHRRHHFNRLPHGDVNFGLFLLVWDRMLGTYAEPSIGAVIDGDVGLVGHADYPVEYLGQITEPFKRH